MTSQAFSSSPQRLLSEVVGAKKRKARTIPFGYRVSEENSEVLIPVPIELEAIEKAIQYRKEKYPWRAIQEWVVKHTGRKISVMGIRKIVLFRKHV